MRPLTKLFTIFCLLVSSSGIAGSIDTVSNEGPRLKNVFIHKTSRKFLGATVEIIGSNGMVITSSQLQKRKLIIDFGDVRYGSYTIRLSKGNATEEFIYIKKD
jgi:hypothetical protein